MICEFSHFVVGHRVYRRIKCHIFVSRLPGYRSLSMDAAMMPKHTHTHIGADVVVPFLQRSTSMCVHDSQRDKSKLQYDGKNGIVDQQTAT